MENLHTDVRCKRLKMYFTPEQPSEEVIFQLCLVTEDQLSFPTAIEHDLSCHGMQPSEVLSFPTIKIHFTFSN